MYRVDGSVNVTPAIAPYQHEFSMLERTLGAPERRRRKEEEEARRKAELAAQEAKYSPGSVNDVEYNDALAKKAGAVIDYTSQAYKIGNIGTPEYYVGRSQLEKDTELVKGKGVAAITEYNKAYQNIDQLPKYVNKTALNTEVYDASHPKNKDGEIDWESLDPQKIASIPSDYYKHINAVDMYAEKTKDIPEKIKSGQIKFTNFNPNDGSADGMMVQTDGLKATFMKPVMDDKGKVLKWIPGVTDQVADSFIDNDPEVKGEAEYQYNKYLEAQTIAVAREEAEQGIRRDPRVIRQEIERESDKRGFMRDHVKNGLNMYNKSAPISELKQVAAYSNPKGGSGDEEDFSVTRMVDQKRNVNTKQPNETADNIVSGDIPEEYRFSGKKLDQPVLVNSTKIYDENTNNAISGQAAVGDKKFFPTRTMLVGYNTKNGKYMHGSLETMKKNPDVVFKWVVGGTIETSEADKEKEDGSVVKVKKNVFMPYEEVSNDIKAKYGFDLNDRDPSQISDLELTSYIKQKYPNATPQEKLKMFNKIRGK